MKQQNKSITAEPVFKAFIYVVLITLAILIIVPVAWVFLASVKQNSEFYGNPWALPAGFYWQNFVDAWNSASMGSYMINSVIVTAEVAGQEVDGEGQGRGSVHHRQDKNVVEEEALS